MQRENEKTKKIMREDKDKETDGRKWGREKAMRIKKIKKIRIENMER